MWTVSALAEQLGVGQASVREAYRILELMGVLEVTPGKGTYLVSGYPNASHGFEQLEQASILEVIEARLIIEPELAARAAERATQQEIEQLFELVRVLENRRWQGLDCTNEASAFHITLLQAAHNYTLLQLVSVLQKQSSPIWQMPADLNGEAEKRIAVYRLIAHSIKDRNPRAARYLMYKHLHDIQQVLQKGEAPLTNEYDRILVDMAEP